jgi:hypothetical protein
MPDPDFLYASRSDGRVCGFHRGKPHGGINATNFTGNPGVGLDRRLPVVAISFRGSSKEQARYRIAVYHFFIDNDAICYL